MSLTKRNARTGATIPDAPATIPDTLLARLENLEGFWVDPEDEVVVLRGIRRDLAALPPGSVPLQIRARVLESTVRIHGLLLPT